MAKKKAAKKVTAPKEQNLPAKPKAKKYWKSITGTYIMGFGMVTGEVTELQTKAYQKAHPQNKEPDDRFTTDVDPIEANKKRLIENRQEKLGL